MNHPSKKTKCRFKECNKPANKQYTLKINGESVPLCAEHGEYTALRMMGVPAEKIKPSKRKPR